MTILYPSGYNTNMISLEVMEERHGPKMHPEFRRRFFAFIEAQDGLLGVGGGWRDVQPDRPGFAPDGKSFHQDQTFASGVVGYAAVDLVAHREGVGRHRAPTWQETETAPLWGLHTFIKSPPEPWHIQCTEMRGWQGWVNAGRPDPDPNFQLPDDTPQEIPPMIAIRPTHPNLAPGLFTVDGHPISPELVEALGDELQIVDQNHKFWDEATLHGLGETARRLYEAL